MLAQSEGMTDQVGWIMFPFQILNFPKLWPCEFLSL